MNVTSTVFVVDDQAAIRVALSRLLGSAGFAVATFASAQEFLDSGCSESPGCLILDLSMPGMNGMTLQTELVARGSVLPIIFLTGNGDIDSSVRAMKNGAADFLTKPVDDERLMAAVRSGFSRNDVARMEQAELAHLQTCWATLTPREIEVLRGVVAGRLNKQIAGDLGAAEKTIKVHRARVMTKMQADSVADLVRITARIDKMPPAPD